MSAQCADNVETCSVGSPPTQDTYCWQIHNGTHENIIVRQILPDPSVAPLCFHISSGSTTGHRVNKNTKWNMIGETTNRAYESNTSPTQDLMNISLDPVSPPSVSCSKKKTSSIWFFILIILFTACGIFTFIYAKKHPVVSQDYASCMANSNAETCGLLFPNRQYSWVMWTSLGCALVVFLLWIICKSSIGNRMAWVMDNDASVKNFITCQECLDRGPNWTWVEPGQKLYKDGTGLQKWIRRMRCYFNNECQCLDMKQYIDCLKLASKPGASANIYYNFNMMNRPIDRNKLPCGCCIQDTNQCYDLSTPDPLNNICILDEKDK